MREDMSDRCVLLANYIIEHQCTVRDAAARFGISKSTVHKDVTQKLTKVNPVLHTDVKNVLNHNKAERHLRGGEATRMKYLRLAESAASARK
jgi:putative DeoR family transcriptional regulator (stage III sporulation protein D)